MSEKTATRHAYGEALVQVGEHTNIVVLDADVSTCTMSCLFAEKFPERFFNMGIAEANMVGVAAGMATAGYRPFVHAFAMFCAGRAFEQIRNSVAYPELDVKLVGTHGGLTVGEDGATHQCLEDFALMRAIPHMTVVCPADANETRWAVKAIVEHQGPVYLRLGRLAVETVTEVAGYKFTLGRAVKLREGTDCTVIAVGCMVQAAIQASERLSKEGISVRVLDMHTIKPLDTETVLAAARETGAIVTAEEHNILGGLGAAVSEYLAEEYPVPVLKIGTQDVFGRSGNAEQLLEYYGLHADHVVRSVKEAMEQKKRNSGKALRKM